MGSVTVESAFWLYPDWSGGDNLRDPGTRPFWELPPKKPPVALAGVFWPVTFSEIRNCDIPSPVTEHVCGPFVTLWTGYRYCKECEAPAP